MIPRTMFTLVFLVGLSNCGFGLGTPRYIESAYHKGDVALVRHGTVVPLCIDSNDYPGVIRAVSDLQGDIERVTGKLPAIVRDTAGLSVDTVIIGTIGKNAIIDQLVQNGKLDVAPIFGKWESFLIQSVDLSASGPKHALIIAGSDKRGTIYGI
ncbi:MAG TPA: glycosyl hydrolase, partial [Alphaproteobacteria bacterium]|nr:glycosyl hydrolase [Alphaproteobacteria bacterium]